jgi:hypothetical protein
MERKGTKIWKKYLQFIIYNKEFMLKYEIYLRLEIIKQHPKISNRYKKTNHIKKSCRCYTSIRRQGHIIVIMETEIKTTIWHHYPHIGKAINKAKQTNNNNQKKTDSSNYWGKDRLIEIYIFFNFGRNAKWHSNNERQFVSFLYF